MHPRDGTEGAADQGQHEQGRLGNAPGSFARLVLVYAHEDETCAVDSDQIYDDKCDRVHKFILFLQSWEMSGVSIIT